MQMTLILSCTRCFNFQSRKTHVFGVFTFDSSEESLCKYSYLVLEEESFFLFSCKAALTF